MAFATDKKSLYSNHNTPKQFPNNSVASSKSGMQKKGGKPSYFCTHCKISGHSMERCFKIHGYPPGFQSRKVAVVSCNDLKFQVRNYTIIYLIIQFCSSQ